jgi:hypothetical protein
VKVRLHSTGDASPGAALLLPQIQPGILGRRALPAARLAVSVRTPDFHHGPLAHDSKTRWGRWRTGGSRRNWTRVRTFATCRPSSIDVLTGFEHDVSRAKTSSPIPEIGGACVIWRPASAIEPSTPRSHARARVGWGVRELAGAEFVADVPDVRDRVAANRRVRNALLGGHIARTAVVLRIKREACASEEIALNGPIV